MSLNSAPPQDNVESNIQDNAEAVEGEGSQMDQEPKGGCTECTLAKENQKACHALCDRHKQCCQNNEWDPSNCSECDFFFCLYGYTDKEKLTELKQMLDEVRSNNHSFYYKISEALDIDKNKDQVSERAESDEEYENNENYEDADGSDDQSVSSSDGRDKYPLSRSNNHNSYTNDDTLFNEFKRSSEDLPGLQTFMHKGSLAYYFDPRIHQWLGDKKLKMLLTNPKTGCNETEIIFINKINQSQFYIVDKQKKQQAEAPYPHQTRTRMGFLESLDLQLSERTNNEDIVELPIQEDWAIKKLMNHILSLDGELITAALDELPKGLNDQFKSLDNSFSWEYRKILDMTNGIMPDSAWARFSKHDYTNLEELNKYLDIKSKEVARNSHNLLVEEKLTRISLCNTMAVLAVLEKIAKSYFPTEVEQEHVENTQKNSILGVCSMLIPQVKNDIIRWYIAKMNLRKSIVAKTKTVCNSLFLNSSVWDDRLFPLSCYEQFKEKFPTRHLAQVILLTDKYRNKRSASQNDQRPFPVPQKRQRQHYNSPSTSSQHGSRRGEQPPRNFNKKGNNKNLKQRQAQNQGNSNRSSNSNKKQGNYKGKSQYKGKAKTTFTNDSNEQEK